MPALGSSIDPQNVLLVIQLGGGNDGLNTVVPYSDDAYHRVRPAIGIEARSVLREVRPKVAVLTHFSTKMLEQRPERLAKEVEDELGFRVFAAYDGWTLDVATEVAAAGGA